MFRNKSKIVSTLLVNGVVGVPWFFLSAILAFYMILIFTGQVEDAEQTDYGMSVIMVGLSFFCAYVFGGRCLRALRANKLGKYFEGSEDGLVSIEAAAAYMNMKQQKFFQVFLDCLGKAYLKNCSVFTEDPTFILLENGGKTIAEKFAIIHCKKCGAPNVIRIGFENTCKYCSSIVEWKE